MKIRLLFEYAERHANAGRSLDHRVNVGEPSGSRFVVNGSHLE